MRKLILIALLLSLLLTACDTQGPNLGNDLNTLPTNPVITEPLPTQSTTPATEPTTPLPEYPYTDLICGIYKMPNMDPGTAQYLQVYPMGESFLLEFSYWDDGECLDIWAQEFWPDGQVYEGLTVSGLNQMFYGGDAAFFYGPADYSVTLSEDTLILTSGTAEKIGYIRDTEFPGVHTDAHQLHEALLSRYTPAESCEAVGNWYFYNDFSEALAAFSPDGQFRYICKSKHAPVLYLEGAWICDSESGNILCMYERPGGYKYIESLRIEWYMQDDQLFLLDVDGETPLLHECAFSPVEDQWKSQLTMYDQAGYVTHRRFEEGEYLVDGMYEEDYYYAIPQLLPYTDVTERINQEIYDYLDPIITEEMDKVYNGGYRYYGYIEWEQQVYDGIVSILVTEIPLYYYRTFRVYLYDAAADKQITGRELVARMGYDEAYVLDYIRQEMEFIFHDTYSSKGKDDQAYQDALAWTLSDENIHLDIPFCIGYDGLMACVVLGSPYEEPFYTTVDIPLP